MGEFWYIYTEQFGQITPTAVEFFFLETPDHSLGAGYHLLSAPPDCVCVTFLHAFEVKEYDLSIEGIA